jgi:ArsR family transcriptional regulator, arsenate/arsenite/antimonite-responsive transcriptional repressor
MTSATATAPAGPAADACCAPAVGVDSGLDAERVAAVAKALSEPLRVRIVDVLRRSDADVCQCELIALFDIKQSLLSHHIRKLVDAGLVQVERRHRWAYYSIPDDAREELNAWLSLPIQRSGRRCASATRPPRVPPPRAARRAATAVLPP